jgi:hypothetical protein
MMLGLRDLQRVSFPPHYSLPALGSQHGKCRRQHPLVFSYKKTLHLSHHLSPLVLYSIMTMAVWLVARQGRGQRVWLGSRRRGGSSGRVAVRMQHVRRGDISLKEGWINSEVHTLGGRR